MLRNFIMIVMTTTMLTGCSGGVSGVMTSSGTGQWQFYRINYASEMASKLEQPAEALLENAFFKLGFRKTGGWGKPLLKNAMVAKFKTKYRERYISMDVQISRKNILLMTTSYNQETEGIFTTLESELALAFGETNIEQCYGTKDINGHTCFNKQKGPWVQ